MSFAVVSYPVWAKAWATLVVPLNASSTVCTSRTETSSRICGRSLSFDPAYLMPSVLGILEIVFLNILEIPVSVYLQFSCSKLVADDNAVRMGLECGECA